MFSLCRIFSQLCIAKWLGISWYCRDKIFYSSWYYCSLWFAPLFGTRFLRLWTRRSWLPLRNLFAFCLRISLVIHEFLEFSRISLVVHEFLEFSRIGACYVYVPKQIASLQVPKQMASLQERLSVPKQQTLNSKL
jgi:hypothetical protein